jgi:hypothetical protein
VLLLAPTGTEQARLLGPTEEAIQSSTRYQIVLLPALITLMRQADDTSGVRNRAARLAEEGRKAQLALQYDQAQERFTAALSSLKKSFVRHYDPRVLAQIHLLLGVLALNKTRPDLARQEFVNALHLDPTLKPDAHFSPQVRSAYEEAARSLPPRPAPPTGDVQRIIGLAGAKIALVLSVQGVGEQSLVKAALFQDQKRSYTSVESVLLNPANAGAARQRARELGKRLRQSVEALLPAPASRPVVVKIKKKPIPKPPPPPKPWYLRWYTWVAAGAVVATAIIVPLAVREEHVGVDVTFPPPPRP